MVDYPVLPDRFRLSLPDVLRNETSAANDRNIERWGNALPFNGFIATDSTQYPVNIPGTIVFDLALDQLLVGDGTTWTPIAGSSTTLGAWTSFTPTVKLGGTTVTIAANDSRYFRNGREIRAEYRFRFSNLNGGTGNLSITYPVTARDVNPGSIYQFSYIPMGDAWYVDQSPAQSFPGRCLWLSTTAFSVLDVKHPTASFFSDVYPVTVAVGAKGTGDELYAETTFESAT